MKKHFLIATFLLTIAWATPAQTAAQQPQPGADKTVVQIDAAAEAAVAEAERLSIEVVKLYKAGQYNEALPLAERVIELRQKALGAAHPSVADALGSLATLYIARQDNTKAEELYQRALTIYDKAGERDSLSVIRVLDYLTQLHYLKRDFINAATYGQRALTLKEQRFGHEHPEVAQTLTHLIRIHAAQGDEGKVRKLMVRLVAILEKQHGTLPEATFRLLGSYVCALAEQEQTAGAADLEKRIEHLLMPDISPAQPAATAPLSGGVLNGKAICKPTPAYPKEAKQARTQGIVTVQIVVDESGKVTSAKAINGPNALKLAAEDAARRARFTPTLLMGQPVKVSGIITYNFVLR